MAMPLGAMAGVWGVPMSGMGMGMDTFQAPPAEIAGLWGSPGLGCSGSDQKNNSLDGLRTPSDDEYDSPLAAASIDITAAAAAAVAQQTTLHDMGFGMENTVRKAQEAAALNAYHGFGHFSADMKPICDYNDFMGAWVDSKGNSVSVVSVDAYSGSISAILSRGHGRPDAHLTIEPTYDGGWKCGNSYLDLHASSTEKLHWVRSSDGFVSVWTRGRC